MPFPRGDDGRSGRRTAAGWYAILQGAALSAGIIGAFALPVSARASERGIATANLTTIEGTAGASLATPSPMAVSATPVSDAQLANEEAKGISEPQSAMPEVARPPRVILWDEIDRPGGLPLSGSTVTIITGAP